MRKRNSFQGCKGAVPESPFEASKDGSAHYEIEECNTDPCPTMTPSTSPRLCAWTSWSGWSKCLDSAGHPKTCTGGHSPGPGKHMRFRQKGWADEMYTGAEHRLLDEAGDPTPGPTEYAGDPTVSPTISTPSPSWPFQLADCEGDEPDLSSPMRVQRRHSDGRLGVRRQQAVRRGPVRDRSAHAVRVGDLGCVEPVHAH